MTLPRGYDNTADVAKVVGKIIRVQRKRLRISGAKLGRHIGVGPNSISAIERGENMPRIMTLYLIVAALDITMSEFFRLTDVGLNVLASQRNKTNDQQSAKGSEAGTARVRRVARARSRQRDGTSGTDRGSDPAD